jgi:hypothetical protein
LACVCNTYMGTHKLFIVDHIAAPCKRKRARVRRAVAPRAQLFSTRAPDGGIAFSACARTRALDPCNPPTGLHCSHGAYIRHTQHT